MEIMVFGRSTHNTLFLAAICILDLIQKHGWSAYIPG